jgi:hypothetical protein
MIRFLTLLWLHLVSLDLKLFIIKELSSNLDLYLHHCYNRLTLDPI